MIVVYLESFFQGLDQLLGERDGDGAPSSHDFLEHDLPPASEYLERDYERWSHRNGDIWTLTMPGRVTRAFALHFYVVDATLIAVYDVALDLWDAPQ